MNEFLAELYGTGAEAEAEIEKTAEAQMLDELEKIASAEGIDLNDLSDDDIVEILADALEDDSEVKVASEEVEEDDELTDEDTEKLAEADFLGRVMAHALYQELSDIGEEAEKLAYSPAGNSKALMVGKLKEYVSTGGPKMPCMPTEGKVPQNSRSTDKTSADEMVMIRAQEILDAAANMIDDEEKTSADEEAITEAALEVLDANGYDTDLIVSLLTEE